MQQAKAGLGGDGDQTVEVLSIMGLTTPFRKRNKRGPSPGTPETSQIHFFLLTMMFFFFFLLGPDPANGSSGPRRDTGGHWRATATMMFF